MANIANEVVNKILSEESRNVINTGLGIAKTTAEIAIIIPTNQLYKCIGTSCRSIHMFTCTIRP